MPAEAIVSLVDTLAPLGYRRRESAATRLAGGQIVMHRLTKIVTGDPDLMVVDVIEVQPGVTSQAWDSRVAAHWEKGVVTVVSRQGLIALKRLRGPGARGGSMTVAERAVLAASQARDLCLSLRRAFRGPPAVARLRAGTGADLDHDDLVLALGLVWASGDIAFVRRALDELDPIRVAADPSLSAFQDAVRSSAAG